MAAFIPSKAPHADAANKFLNYVLQPEKGKEWFEFLGYYCTFSASDALINPDYAPLLVLPQGAVEKAEIIGNISQAANDEHMLVWNAFKAAAGK
jgi:spermidine/putrescine transport system substrate-binding protein